MENDQPPEIGVILLAAGESARLGAPKQLLFHDGRSFVRHAVTLALASVAHPVVVVLGAYADEITAEVAHTAAHIVVNEDWREGMAASIRRGIGALTRISPAAAGAILMVCDQPYVTASLLNGLIAAHDTSGQPIVTCSYADTFGPPTLFHQSLFSELMALKGDVGARSVLQQHRDKVVLIEFAAGAADIDTGEDYEAYLKGKQADDDH